MAATFVLRCMAAGRKYDRAVAKARHADVEPDTVVSFGPIVEFAPTGAVAHHHGRLDADQDTVVSFGPSLEIPLNPR